MKRLLTIAGIILGLLAITLFTTCDISSPFVDEIQRKIDADTIPTYTVSYDANGATGGSIPVDSNRYVSGSTFTMLGNMGNLAKAEQTFAGWNTQSNRNGTAYAPGQTLTISTNNVILYAQWLSDINSSNIGWLRVVPAGIFQRDSTPVNISVVTSGFRMSEHEITRAQFELIMGAGTDPSDTNYSSSPGDPVQNVNWYHAIVFCNKLSIAEGLTQVYSVSEVNFNTLVFDDIPTTGNSTWNAARANWSANGYRLPTEMEWMWAAMGAIDDYTKPFAGSDGSNGIGDYAVFGYNTGETGATTTERSNPVGSKLPNELGLYDMSGNVYEWNWDLYGSYPAGIIYSDTAGGGGAASGANCVIRGGSWLSEAFHCTVAYRYSYSPYYQNFIIAFRVVRP
ncbi:MAG: SUMF1/EgtB/PvdO family nonheme iron enzyme [Spirochaetaceae bacterium]|nr:SUMF1/EgtB/PvdO family nonheme iron enzyme [Spirochaetaceae bacterium]